MNGADRVYSTMLVAESPADVKPKVDMKDVGEAMFVLMMLAGTFIVVAWWAKRQAKRRKSQGQKQTEAGGAPVPQERKE